MIGRTLSLAVALASALHAQGADTAVRASGRVSGLVVDSLTRAALAGAVVQLISSAPAPTFGRTTTSDSVGAYRFTDVPSGRYTLGFFHPVLDSLGLEPTIHEVEVADEQPLRVDLGVPSIGRLRAAVCGNKPHPDYRGFVIGIVRSANTRAPLRGVTVAGQWVEFKVTGRGLTRYTPLLSGMTADNGWFAICNVPAGATISLSATNGIDSTDVIDVQIPADGYLRRELYLGSARAIVNGVSTGASPSRVGAGVFNGVVVTTLGAQLLPGAVVRIIDGPSARTNEDGQFSIPNAPTGTRMVEVRAVGYYPERKAVDIVPGERPVIFELATFKSVLDTVVVRAKRDRDRNGFDDRRRKSAGGKFLTRADISAQNPVVTSDIFKHLPGIRLEYDSTGFDKRIWMRGTMGDWCLPAIFLDSHKMRDLSPEDIDAWIKPSEIAGIEVYFGAQLPREFEDGMTACGSILIWRKWAR